MLCGALPQAVRAHCGDEPHQRAEAASPSPLVGTVIATRRDERSHDFERASNQRGIHMARIALPIAVLMLSTALSIAVYLQLGIWHLR